jgi:multiple sugar transport system substrate-binding protein
MLVISKMKKVKVTVLLALLVLTVFSIALTGVSANQSLSVIYQYSNQSNIEGVEAVLKKFKEANPDVELKVQAVQMNQFYKILETRVVAGDLPDVAIATAAIIPSYYERGVLANLTSYLPNNYLQSFVPARAAVHKQGKTIVGAPISNSIRAVAYNKTVFEKAGIKAPGANDAPWTWTQLVEAAKKLQKMGLVKYGLQFEKPSFDGWMPILYQNGGQLLDDNNKPVINSKAGIGAIAWTADLHKKGIAAPGVLEGTEDPLRLFASGRVGIWLLTGQWMIPSLESQVTNFEYSFMLLPKNVKATTILGGSDIIAFKGKNIPLAAKFIQFVTSAENITLQTNATGGFPARGDAQNIKMVRPDLVPLFMKQAESTDIKMTNDYYSPVYGKIKDQCLRELQAAIIGQITPKQAADRMNAIIKSELSK